VYIEAEILGVPLPIWSDGKDIYAVGSFKELMELTTAIEVKGEHIDFLPEI
jgi:hypothetical protein